MEVLVSVAILGSGLVILCRPLISSMDALRFSNIRMEANRLLWDESWSIQNRAFEVQDVKESDVKEVESLSGPKINYQMVSAALTDDKKLYHVTLSAFWIQGGREKRLVRTLYVWVPA